MPKIDTGISRPPADRFVCDEIPEKPNIRPLEAFKAANGALAYYKADVDQRNNTIAEFIVAFNGSWFSCSSQLQWHKNYWDGFEN